MELQRQPNRWSCLPTAFAMCFDIPVTEVIIALKHDGSAIIRSDKPEPYKRRGFHPQELILYGLQKRFAVIPIDILGLALTDGETITPIEQDIDEMNRIINSHIGVMTGYTKPEYKPHAVAWDGDTIYDPNGTFYGPDRFQIATFYLIIRLK